MELGSYGGLDLLCQLISIRIWVNMSRIHTSCSYRDTAINQTLECETTVGEINHKAKKVPRLGLALARDPQEKVLYGSFDYIVGITTFIGIKLGNNLQHTN
ncbi:hypothetical protein Bca101_076165 [Brassica carinata]